MGPGRAPGSAGAGTPSRRRGCRSTRSRPGRPVGSIGALGPAELPCPASPRASAESLRRPRPLTGTRSAVCHGLRSLGTQVVSLRRPYGPAALTLRRRAGSCHSALASGHRGCVNRPAEARGTGRFAPGPSGRSGIRRAAAEDIPVPLAAGALRAATAPRSYQLAGGSLRRGGRAPQARRSAGWRAAGSAVRT